MKKIMGLDISSSCIGIALLEWDDQSNKVIFNQCKFYKPPKKGEFLERLMETKKAINQIIQEFKPDYIAIEDIIQFMGHGSTAKTIITLAAYNRTIGLLAYEYLGKLPELYSVMAIRHGLKLAKELPAKEEMPLLIAKHLKIKFPFLYKKDGKTPKSESFDMADACAVATYYAFVLSGKIQRKKK